jgi:rhamnulokinase
MCGQGPPNGKRERVREKNDNMKTQRVLAVDLGASGGKSFVGSFAEDGFSMLELHRFAHEGTPFFAVNRTGAVEERVFWDDVYIYRNIMEGLQAYRREVGPRLDAIGIDTWGTDGQFFTQDGDMLGRVYCYRDHRLDAMIEQVKARIDAERLYTITGIHFQPFNISNQLLWFMLNRAELLQPGTFYLPVPALFYYYLGGGRYVDSSWASVTQLMDAATKNWSVEVLDALAIPHAVMPEIVAPGARVGALTRELAERLTLNEAPLVAVAAHDTASAFAAAPVSDPARALIISSGTWSLVGKLVDRPFTTREAMQANLSNEGGIGNIRLLKNCMGGWLVQELRRVWRVADGCEMDWKTMDSLTEQAAPFAALIDPDDAAFYNPANMEAAIAEFCRRTGQCVPEGRGAFMRVVYESLALKYRLINEQICGVTGSTTEVVHVVGGGSKNILLNQFAADALGLPVIAGPEEATAVGNIMVQAIGIGRIGSMAEAQPMIRSAFPIREYRPRNTGAWDAPYARFRDLCGA